mmetsp:Transcript_68783/g.150321  ORF Transcript_68783/g.150321 Transcript_68783/m.150321 type:complete len:149 (-) Transcript_68783:121-567(-)
MLVATQAAGQSMPALVQGVALLVAAATRLQLSRGCVATAASRTLIVRTTLASLPVIGQAKTWKMLRQASIRVCLHTCTRQPNFQECPRDELINAMELGFGKFKKFPTFPTFPTFFWGRRRVEELKKEVGRASELSLSKCVEEHLREFL